MTYLGAYRDILLSADLLALRRAKPVLSGEPLRLLILRTCTVEALVPYLKLAMADWGIPVEVDLAPFGDLSPPTSELRYDAVLLWWRLEDLAPDLLLKTHRLGAEGRQQLGESLLFSVQETLTRLKTWNQAPLWVQALDLSPWGGDHFSAGKMAADAVIWSHRLNLYLLECCASTANFHWWSHSLWSRDEMTESFVDERMDLLGRVPLAAAAMGRWALGFAEQLQMLRLPRRKVLAVDADHTLWGGVLGEEGIQGIKLGLDYPGNVYHRLQQRLLELKSTGILLVLLSKNDEAAVYEVLEQHPECPLQREDFVATRCNYEDKPQNLLSVAKELQLDPSSFAFLDDQPFEREQMRQAIPSVLILNASPEPLEMLKSLEHPELRSLHFTTEDGQKTQQYQQEQQRQQLEQQPIDRQEFLKSLQLQVKLSPLTELLIPRALQLLAKTNQFNLTTRRHGEAQLRAWLGDPQVEARMVHVQDRFGEQGWVGLWIALKEENNWVVDSFLLSCRVLGRGIETVFWRELMLEAQKQNASSLKANYLPTPRNALVANFWKSCGMELERCSENGEKTYCLLVSQRDLPCPDHIAIVNPA